MTKNWYLILEAIKNVAQCDQGNLFWPPPCSAFATCLHPCHWISTKRGKTVFTLKNIAKFSLK